MIRKQNKVVSVVALVNQLLYDVMQLHLSACVLNTLTSITDTKTSISGENGSLQSGFTCQSYHIAQSIYIYTFWKGNLKNMKYFLKYN